MDSSISLVLVSVILALAGASASSQAPNATSRATKPHKITALQRSTIATQVNIVAQKGTLNKPRGEGRHFLHKDELQPIVSVHCLQEKQLHPDRPCSELEDEKSFSGPINMGHFPNWQDGVCNSNFEYFCDPANLFKDQERQMALQRLQVFNERMMVNCGEFSPEQDPHSSSWYDANNPVHYGRLGLEGHRPFNLAIVVADEWPSTERDPKSLEYFGNVIMAQWGLMPKYNGVDHNNNVNKNPNSANQVYSFNDANRNCPNTAVLFILPRYREAFLSSPSCKFICESRGGPEVVAATLAGLDRGGLQEAVTMGIDEVEKILQVTGEHKASDQNPFTGLNTRNLMENDTAWIWTLRMLYVLVIGIALLFIVAFVYYVLLDKARHSRTSYSAMTDANGRRTLQETYMQG